MEKDLENHIMHNFPLEQHDEVTTLLNSIKKENINVGVTQLQRAVVTIARGDINMIKEIIDSNFYNDPRDVIMMAIEKGLNNSGMWPLGK